MDERALEETPAQHGLFAIEGRLVADALPAGLIEGFYLLDKAPWSANAFMVLWDMEDWTCQVYEELMEHSHFRQPLPRLLEPHRGILFLSLIALRPSLRGQGLGRQVLEKTIASWCDDQVGAVVIDARPLQRRQGSYDFYDQEVRELPWQSPEEDIAKLAKHLRGWGFHRIAGTRFMVAAPGWLGLPRAGHWPAVPIEDDDPFDDDDFPWRDDDVPF